MSDRELEALRRHGFGVAYRMLGSVTDAEDVAQEALLRLTRQEGSIDEPAAWMTTVVTRLSINALKSARARRESFGEFESRLVRVNGQPGRLVQSPGEEPFGEAERLAAQKALALLKAGDLDAKQLAALMIRALDRAARDRAGAEQQGELRVRDVLTVDVVEGRIQAVRIVRNPDKLGHL